MVHHEPLDHLFAEIDGFPVGGRNHQAIPCFEHAAHLNPFDRAFTLHRADAASPDGSQGRVVAEARDDDAQLFSRFDDLRPVRDFYLMTINDEFGHRSKRAFSYQPSAFSKYDLIL
jgi:hypothetical protein